MKPAAKLGLGALALLALSYQSVKNAYETIERKQEVQASSLYAKPDATLTKDTRVSTVHSIGLEEYLADTALYPLEVDVFTYADLEVLQYNDAVPSWLRVPRPELQDIRTVIYNSGVIDMINCGGQDIRTVTLLEGSYLVLGRFVLDYQIEKRKEEGFESAKADL